MLKKSAKILAFSTHSIHADHKNNGDDGIRTRDLSVANAALSQLSYVPMGNPADQSAGIVVVLPTCLL